MISTVRFQDREVVCLRAGDSEILLAPQHGARLLRWHYQDRPVVPWPTNADWSLPAKVRGGNPILFPYIARHFVDGVQNRWRDAAGVVRDMPMHGFARPSAFTPVPDPAPGTIRLRLESSPANLAFYPFAFTFDVVYRLAGSLLTAEFITTNHSPDPMPWQAGHHFYFAIPHAERADWELRFPSRRTGRQQPDGSILFGEAPADHARLNDPDLSDRFQLDSGLGDVLLSNHRDARTLRFHLKATPGFVPWYAVTTWTEKPDSDFYCIEPWLGLPNAIHHGLGLRWLAPGTTETASCTLELEKW